MYGMFSPIIAVCRKENSRVKAQLLNSAPFAKSLSPTQLVESFWEREFEALRPTTRWQDK